MAVSAVSKVDPAATDISLDLLSRRMLGVADRSPMNARAVTLFLFLWTAQFAPGNPTVVSRIPREPVVSTGIRSIGYSKHRHILEIQFVNGAVYRYLEVSESVYHELIAADSKARYYDTKIKGNYPSLKVRSRPKR